MNIKRLSLSGGGAKVASYLGMYEVFYKSDMLKIIDDISGASAGSICAAFAAIGADPNYMRKKLMGINFYEMLGDITYSLHPPYFCKNGKPIKYFLRKIILKIIRKHLNNLLHIWSPSYFKGN